jgi:hypothetical protein
VLRLFLGRRFLGRSGLVGVGVTFAVLRVLLARRRFLGRGGGRGFVRVGLTFSVLGVLLAGRRFFGWRSRFLGAGVTFAVLRLLLARRGFVRGGRGGIRGRIGGRWRRGCFLWNIGWYGCFFRRVRRRRRRGCFFGWFSGGGRCLFGSIGRR